jgi:hypothetical protein
MPVMVTARIVFAVLHATYSFPVAALKPGCLLLGQVVLKENDGGVVAPYGAAATSITYTVPLGDVAYRCPPGWYAKPNAWSLSVASSVVALVA